MANLRNNTGSPAAARSGETMQEVRDRWAGEISTTDLPPEPTWNEPWSPADTRFGVPSVTGQTGQMGQGGQMRPGSMMGPQMGQMGPMMNQPMDRMDRMDRMDGMQMGPMNPGGMPMQSGGLEMSRSGQSPRTDGLDMNNMLPSQVIESPTTMNEAYLGSLKAMLLQNKGNYIVATFLVGTQNTVSWEGILYEVGNDYVTIYQPGRDRYIVSDMYSLRYMEFYDIQRRELCNQLLRERGWQNSSW